MIAIGCDHGGFALKEAVRAYLEKEQIPYEDFGTYNEDSVDYALIAEVVTGAITSGKATQGILCCGTGIGISIAANKVKGIRAAVVTNEFMAEMTRKHNDANVLCLAGRVSTETEAVAFAKIFLHTAFEGGRHQRRIDQITDIEEKQ